MKPQFIYNFVAPGGDVLTHHVLEWISIAGGRVEAAVSGYPDASLDKVAWQGRHFVPAACLSAEPEASVAEWLVSAEGPFSGATLVQADAAAFDKAAATLRAKVKDRRNAAEWAGVTIEGIGTVDSDPDAQRKVSGAVVMAMLGGEAFSVDWRMKDNTSKLLDAQAMIAVGVQVGRHVVICQGRKDVLDAQVSAATTIAELDQIDFESGWPA